jgi:hypothetical protein
MRGGTGVLISQGPKWQPESHAGFRVSLGWSTGSTMSCFMGVLRALNRGRDQTNSCHFATYPGSSRPAALQGAASLSVPIQLPRESPERTAPL